MEKYQFENLLGQVNDVIKRYKKIDELTGENFNVFRILKLESSEVRMHSAFIAELLNPNGSHGQKDNFLILFVKQFCFKGNQIDTASCRVKVEDYIGPMNEGKTEGGRIDITIKDKHENFIIIENKIYAGDQEHQLARYFKHANTADIIYLTLEGSSPSEKSRGTLVDGENYKCYSYKNHLLDWLELCRKEVAVFPIVREAITHYINLIKHLTNQTQNQNMQEELSDLLKLNLEASFTIANNLDEACQKASNDFGVLIEKEFENIGLLCDYDIDFDFQYSGIWIKKPEWKYVRIGFQFQKNDKDMIYGISCIKDPSDFPIPLDLKSKLKALPNNTPRNNNWWGWFRNLEYPFNNWNQLDAWQTIIDGRMKDMLIEKTQHLINLTGDLDM